MLYLCIIAFFFSLQPYIFLSCNLTGVLSIMHSLLPVRKQGMGGLVLVLSYR